MAKLDCYIDVGRERLRCGYTTGTCAAGAALCAALFLETGRWPDGVTVDTPAGIAVAVEPESCESGPGWASCAVRKDGGDDPDITDGSLVFARVERIAAGVEVEGGPGVGRVTKPGLDQPVGAAAINTVPRRMITGALAPSAARLGCGLRAVISVPGGEALAARTFNPRLGIEGGISILGTSGIVRPMSEAALVESVRLEIRTIYASGARDLLLTPGNYGDDFSRTVLGLGSARRALCSNYAGEAIDCAAALGFDSVLLVGHLGKLVKLAAGCFNTHSRAADARRETICTHAALCGADRTLVRALFDSPTTDAAVALLCSAGLCAPVMDSLAEALGAALRRRAGDMRIEALFFSNKYGVLGRTGGADGLLARHAPPARD